MTAAARKHDHNYNVSMRPGAKPSPLAVLVARAEAKAMLWAAGELDDEDDALLEGLKFCADTERHLEEWERRKAKAAAQDENKGCNTTFDSADDDYAGLSSSFAAACRAADANRFVRAGDIKRLQLWLAKRSADERSAIQKHLGRQAWR